MKEKKVNVIIIMKTFHKDLVSLSYRKLYANTKA